MPGLWYAINCKDIFAYRTLVQVSQIALACANFCRQGPIRDELWPITSEHWSNQWEAELGDVIRGRSQSPELVSPRVYQPGSTDFSTEMSREAENTSWHYFLFTWLAVRPHLFVIYFHSPFSFIHLMLYKKLVPIVLFYYSNI